MLFSQQSNLLIQVAKIVNDVVVRVETLKQWQCLKVYNMLLESYLIQEKIRFLKKKVESLTSILRQATPR